MLESALRFSCLGTKRLLMELVRQPFSVLSCSAVGQDEWGTQDLCAGSLEPDGSFTRLTQEHE